MMQQTAVSPQLQALMTLAQGTQQGAVSPVTPDGRPTVAGQLLQQAAPQPAAPQGMPPGMPQMRQNAGIAGQIQAMQMQEAQKQMMQQAQAQQRMQQNAPVLGGGIAAAPGAQGVRMAEGGIVGYAGDEGSWVERLPEEALLRKFVENYRAGRGLLDFGAPTAEKPATKTAAPEVPVEFNLSTEDPANAISTLVGALRDNPNMPASERKAIGDEIAAFGARLPSAETATATPSAASSSAPAAAPRVAPAAPAAPRVDTTAADAMFEKGLATLGGVKTEAPSAADVTKRTTEMSEGERAYLLSRGVDPDLLAKEIARREALSKREVELYEQRERDTREGAARKRLMAFLGGAEGRSPWRGSNQARDVEASRQEGAIQKAQDAALAAQKASMQEQFLLRQAQDQIARGDWKGAQTSLAQAQEEKNKHAIALGKAQIDVGEAKNRQALGAAGIAAQVATGTRPSAQVELYQLLGNGDVAKGMQRAMDIQAGKFSPMQAYTEYLKSRKDDGITPPMSYAEYLGKLGVTVSPIPEGGSVKKVGS